MVSGAVFVLEITAEMPFLSHRSYCNAGATATTVAHACAGIRLGQTSECVIDCR